MKKMTRALALLLVLIIPLSFICSCSNNTSQNHTSPSSSSNGEYDITLYNFKPEMQSFYREICEYYTSETGVKIRFIESDPTKTNIENIRSLMDSFDRPNIFTIQGLSELQELNKDNIVLNLNNAPGEKFKDFTSEIPDDLRLATDNYSNYGIPYNIEGYGYLADKQMLCDLFGLEDCSTFCSDLKASTYNEFKELVLSADRYITSGAVSTIVLNGNKYTFAPTKTDLSQNLKSVFSVAGADEWTYTDHMINIALCSLFDSQYDASKASQIDKLRDPLIKYAKALDLKTTYANIPRGNDFIADSNNYQSAIANFANGKSLFIKQGNWAYNDISKNNSESAKRLTIFPVKLPFESTDIGNKDMSVDKINSSIAIYVPMYYSINADSSELELKLSEDFLLWLNTSEYAKNKLIEDFNTIPSDINTYYHLDNNLNNEILSYKKSNNYISAPYLGAPYLWKENLGGKIKEEYLTKPDWSSDDYQSIADLAISEWNSLRK